MGLLHGTSVADRFIPPHKGYKVWRDQPATRR
jgi:hypothetical protein